MKRFLMLLTIALTCLSLFAATAEARRFGGGGSIGKQRTMAPQQAQSVPTAAPSFPGRPAPAPAPAGNKWLGPLAGLAIGAGLGALFAGGGMGGAMGGILMAVVAGSRGDVPDLPVSPEAAADAICRRGCAIRRTSTRPAAGILAERRTCAAYATQSIPADFPVESFSAQRQDFVHPPAGRE